MPAEYVAVIVAARVKWQLCVPSPPSAAVVLPSNCPASASAHSNLPCIKSPPDDLHGQHSQALLLNVNVVNILQPDRVDMPFLSALYRFHWYSISL